GFLPVAQFFKDSQNTKLGLSSRCKHCSKLKNQVWSKNNPERIKELGRIFKEKNPDYSKNYCSKNKVEISKRNKEWLKNNPEWSKAYYKNKSKTNIQYKLRKNLRTRLHTALTNQLASKRFSSLEVIGCSFEELIKHLESTWLPGMSWANWGRGKDKWHI